MFRNFLLVFIFYAFLLAAADFVNPDIQGIIDRGKIVIALYKIDVPPFFYTDRSGNLQGIDIEIARNIADKLGVKLELNRESPSFDSVVDKVISGEADLAVSELSITLERAKKVYYTQPYFSLHMALLINHLKMAELKPGQTLQDLLNTPQTRIGILGNSSYEEFSREQFPNAKIISFQEWEGAVAAAGKGEIDVAFYDETVIERSIRENPALSLRFGSLILKDKLDLIAIAVSLRTPLLLEWVRHFLEMNPVKQDLRSHFDDYIQVMKITETGVVSQAVDQNEPRESDRSYLIILILLACIASALACYKHSRCGYAFCLRWLLSPWTVLSAMILGAFFGYYFKESTGKIAFIGGLYLTLLKMCALPIMITAIMSSLGQLFKSSDAITQLRKLLLLMLMFLFLASFCGLFGGAAGKPGTMLSEKDRIILGHKLHKGELEKGNQPDQNGEKYGFVKRLLPENIFAALSNGDVLSVLVFSILFGVSLAFVNEKASDHIFKAMETVFHAFLKIIEWSMYVLPPALFCLMAEQVSNTGLSIMLAMGRFVAIYYLICIIFILGMGWILSRTLKAPFYQPFITLKESLLVAFGTFSSYAAMPFAINSLISKFNLQSKTTNLVMPLGITICRPGTIINLALSTVFISQLFGVPIFEHYRWLLIFFGAVLAGLSAAGAPSAIEISALAVIFTPLGLPLSVALILLLAVDPITDPIRTVLNVITNCSITSLVAEQVEVKT
ncbi:MAG: cation:dicarboxylase symporter family transporter [Candidatus Wallbacteria bacterium]|nr:cation:dicarboxylase symporter family transporter [Candidatus Wallbacteria bacterium]